MATGYGPIERMQGFVGAIDKKVHPLVGWGVAEKLSRRCTNLHLYCLCGFILVAGDCCHDLGRDRSIRAPAKRLHGFDTLSGFGKV
jgi:hypothetical protein